MHYGLASPEPGLQHYWNIFIYLPLFNQEKNNSFSFLPRICAANGYNKVTSQGDFLGIFKRDMLVHVSSRHLFKSWISTPVIIVHTHHIQEQIKIK